MHEMEPQDQHKSITQSLLSKRKRERKREKKAILKLDYSTNLKLSGSLKTSDQTGKFVEKDKSEK